MARLGRPRPLAAALVAAVLVALAPQPAAAAHVALPGTDAPAIPAEAVRWTDAEAGLSLVAPPGWVVAAPSSLNAPSDPPEPVEERVRFQARAGTPSLYAQPLPVTDAVVRDAGAVLSIGLAREGTDLAALRLEPGNEPGDTSRLAGFAVADDLVQVDGLRVLSRYLVARSGTRVVVVRGYVLEDAWSALAPVLRTAIASLRADPAGPNAPALAPAPAAAPPAVVPPAPSAPAADATLAARAAILARAQAMLGTPYLWGGNVAGRGMDCSAYVSATWAVARYTTDSIGRVSRAIAKEELRPGDAMNLTIGRDPQRKGHIRLFEAWANEARSLVWVYEETPPRAVHRVIAYDDRYEPIRLAGLSDAGSTAVVPAPLPAPERSAAALPRAAATSRPAYPFGNTVPYELRGGILVPIASATPAPAATLRPSAPPTARPTPRVVPATPRPTVRASPTPAPTPRASLPGATSVPPPTGRFAGP